METGPQDVPWDLVTEDDVWSAVGNIWRGNRNIWDTRWRQMRNLIRPFEANRCDYDLEGRYEQPCYIEVHPKLVKLDSRLRVVDGLLQLGFIPTDTKAVFRRDPVAAQVLYGKKKQERRGAAERLKQRKRSSQYSRPTASSLSEMGRLERDPNYVQHVTFDTLSQTLSYDTLSPTPSNDAGSMSSLMEDTDAADTASVLSNLRSVISESSSTTDIRELETQVVLLTNQLRSLQTQSHTNPYASNVVPYIMTEGSHLISSTKGGTLVTLQFNYLDPDLAPYSILCGDILLPCVVTDQRFITFITHPRPKGSAPLKVLCGSPPKHYCKSVWLEYKTSQELEALGITCLYLEGFPTSINSSIVSDASPNSPAGSRGNQAEGVDSGASPQVEVGTSAMGAHEGNESLHMPHVLKHPAPLDMDAKSTYSACKSNHTSELKSIGGSDIEGDDMEMPEGSNQEIIAQEDSFSHPPLTKEMLQLLSTLQHQRLTDITKIRRKSRMSLTSGQLNSEPPLSPTHSHYSHHSQHSAPARIGTIMFPRKGSSSSIDSRGSGSIATPLRVTMGSTHPNSFLTMSPHTFSSTSQANQTPRQPLQTHTGAPFLVPPEIASSGPSQPLPPTPSPALFDAHVKLGLFSSHSPVSSPRTPSSPWLICGSGIHPTTQDPNLLMDEDLLASPGPPPFSI